MKVLRVSPSWKTQKMIKVGILRCVFHPKYKRYLKKMTELQAHYPGERTPKVNDQVVVRATRPISASKRHIAWLRE